MFARNRSVLTCSWATFALVLGAWGHSAGTLRADNIDEELIKRGAKIMKFLRQHGYQTVGVHTFQLQKGDTKPSFANGLITTNMAARLENALVMALNPEDKPIGIIKDASLEAVAKLKGASYRTPEQRAQLFTIQYPLAWGTPPKTVSADAFLTGKVTLSEDLRTTKVLLVAFDKATPARLLKVDEFTVHTDRHILGDAGQGYSLSKGTGKFRRGVNDDDIFASIEEDNKTKQGKTPKGVVPGNSTAANVAKTTAPGSFPVELQIKYDGVPQSLQMEAVAPGVNNWTIPDPKEGQKVTFGLRNLTDEVLGVVLAVNGINTLYEEIGQANQMTRWVLEPQKEYVIRGYYRKDKGAWVEIEGLPEQLSREKFEDLGGAGRAGFIHLFVFRKTNQVASSGSTPAFSRSMRRIAPASQPKGQGPAKTPFELQRQIAENANLKGGRGLMAWGAGESQEVLDEKSLGQVALTDTLVIRYFKP